MATTIELWQDRNGTPCCRITETGHEPVEYAGDGAVAMVGVAVELWDGTLAAQDSVARLAAPWERKLKVNRIQCNHCGDIVESTSAHDYRQCGCQRVFADGGLEYARRGYQLPSDYTELSEWE